MADPLADAISKAGSEWWGNARGEVTCAEYQAEAVRALIAQILDAEEKKWTGRVLTVEKDTATIAIDNLRWWLLHPEAYGG